MMWFLEVYIKWWYLLIDFLFVIKVLSDFLIIFVMSLDIFWFFLGEIFFRINRGVSLGLGREYFI